MPKKTADTDLPAAPSPTEARILEAARRLFFAEGFSAVSTDRLCKEAGVSKTSIYKYFGDMAGVLAAVVRREGDGFATGVAPRPETAEAFWRSLVAYGTNLLTLLNDREIIQFDKLLHEEARSHPDVGRSFYDSAFGRSHRDVTALIVHGQARGFVTKTQDSAALADHLICMWEGLACIRTRLGLIDKPYEDPRAWARQCVEALFDISLAD